MHILGRVEPLHQSFGQARGVFLFPEFSRASFNLNGRSSPTTIATAYAHKEAKYC
jgi:hypothetical protein